MSPFSSLAPELIQIIGNELHITDAKSIRLTCKYLGKTLTSQVLRKITINLTQQTLAKDIQKLQEWAGKPHTASRVTRELAINSIYPAYDPTSSVEWFYLDNEGVASNPEPELSPAVKFAGEALKVCLCKAISSMTSVRKVQWMPTPRDPETAQQLVMDGLATLPNLKSLVVRAPCHEAQQRFDILPPLRELSLIGVGKEINVNKLTVKSPELSSLSLEGVPCWVKDAMSKNQSLHGVLEAYPKDIPPLRLRKLCLEYFLVRLDEITLPHLLHLTSLELTHIRDPFKKPDDRLHLDPGITNSPAHQDQKLYGSSLSDIWLALVTTRIHLQEIKTDHVSSEFLTYLESYSGLERLKLIPHGFENGATSDRFGSRFFSSSFQNHMRSIKELNINAPYEGSWCFSADSAGVIAQCPKLYSLTMRITSPSQPDPKHSKHAALVKLFLDTVAEYLPILETLQISATNPEYSRRAPCGSGASLHKARMERNILKVINTYKAPLTCTKLPALQIGPGTRRSLVPAFDKCKDASDSAKIRTRQSRRDCSETPRLIYVTKHLT